LTQTLLVCRWALDEDPKASGGALVLEPIQNIHRGTGDPLDASQPVDGWHYLQEPHEAGNRSHLCTFWAVSEEPHPARALGLINCYGLNPGITATDALAQGQFQLTEVERFEQERRVLDPGVPDDNPRAGDWPAHETPKLRAMRLAAWRFWANYDRDDPGTIPTSQEVREWLLKNHDIKSTVAEAMASILRPDWAPTGPRPK